MRNTADYPEYKERDFRPSGVLRSYKASTDEYWHLDGYTYCSMAKMPTEFYEGGEVKTLTLGKDVSIYLRGKKYLIKNGTAVAFYRSGRLQAAQILPLRNSLMNSLFPKNSSEKPRWVVFPDIVGVGSTFSMSSAEKLIGVVLFAFSLFGRLWR